MIYKKLSEIADIQAGGTPLRSNPEYWNGNIPWIKISDIKSKFVISYDEKISQEGLNNSSAKIFNKGTILYTIFATLGRVGILTFNASTNQAIAGIKITDNNITSEYLYYYLLSIEKKVNSIGNGVAQKNINLTILKEFNVPIITIDQQNHISKTLSQIESIIENSKNQLNLFDELIKSRFVEMFMIDEKDKYPLKKWKDVAIIKHGKDYKKNIASDGGYPVYGSGGFMGVYADKNLANENSIIIGRKGTIDKPILVKEKIWNVDTAFAVEVKKEFLNPIFFYVRSTLYDLKSMSTSTTLPSMTQSTLHNIEIGIPPIKLQNEFANFVKQIDKLKFVVQKRIELYKELLDKKMDEYFN